jgi:hypothetical protein
MASRVDFVVDAPEKAPAPPDDARKAMQDMGATYKLQSYIDVNWRNPRLDSNRGAHISRADAKAKKITGSRLTSNRMQLFTESSS